MYRVPLRCTLEPILFNIFQADLYLVIDDIDLAS